MNQSSSTMSPVLADYRKKSAILRSRILHHEEQRIQLDQKIHSLSNLDSRFKQRQQVEQLQSYLKQINQESQRAAQRNVQLLNDITQAEHNLNQIRMDTEHFIRLKHDYSHYLESSYSNWQKPLVTETSANENSHLRNDSIYDFNRAQHVRQNGLLTHQPSDMDSSTFSKRNDDPTKDDQSLSESSASAFTRSKRPGSLRMELSRPGLYFLLDYIEKELIDTIDKKKFYRHDPPTITQKRTILDIANSQQQFAIKDLDPTTTSMVILDQLPSTIRRTTMKECLLTEDILSLNVIDLNKDSISKMLPEQDRVLWTRLIDHFTRLLKFHIMSSQTLANKFAPTFLPNNVIYLHDKAKSLLKHILEKLVGTQQSSSEDETSTNRQEPIQHIVQGTTASSSSWLHKLTAGGGIDDDDTSSSSTTTPKKNIIKSTNSTPRAKISLDDSDLEFYS